MTILDFAITLVPDLMEKWELYNMTPEELIGKKVVTIRSGFSGGPGRICVISEADEENITFSPCVESMVEAGHLGWGCKYSERHNTFKLYKP
jgi:hypothetical protein